MKTEPYYQLRAKEIVDTLYEAKLFRDDFTRDDMKMLEDLIAFNFESYANTAKIMAETMLKLNWKDEQ
jgi:hypothetical protein